MLSSDCDLLILLVYFVSKAICLYIHMSLNSLSDDDLHAKYHPANFIVLILWQILNRQCEYAFSFFLPLSVKMYTRYM